MEFSDKKDFIKIKTAEEKQKFLETLIKGQYAIFAKTPESQEAIMILKPEHLIDGKIHCKKKNGEENYKTAKGSAIVQIQLTDEKYLAQTTFSTKGDNILIDTNCDFYQLQRREDFRLKFPVNYNAKFVLSSLNDISSKAALNLFDISSGGCRFEINTQVQFIKNDDVLSGELRFFGRDSVQVTGVVKHIAPLNESIGVYLVGVQFSNLSAVSKNKIFALAMDIYRELFSRLK